MRGLWPGDQPFLWQAAMMERRNRWAREFHDNSRRTSSEFYCLSKQCSVSPISDKMSVSAAIISLASGSWRLPALHEESEERLSVFRVFEIPSLVPRGISKLLPLESQHLLLFAGGWHGDCIRRLCVRINKQRLLQKQLEKHNAT
jgi:hypothetical protein